MGFGGRYGRCNGHHLTSWIECKKFAQGRARKLSYNTKLIVHPNGDYGVQLHRTEIITFHPDGSRTLRANDWITPTTMSRWQMSGIQSYKLPPSTVINGKFGFVEGMRLLPNGGCEGHNPNVFEDHKKHVKRTRDVALELRLHGMWATRTRGLIPRRRSPVTISRFEEWAVSIDKKTLKPVTMWHFHEDEKNDESVYVEGYVRLRRGKCPKCKAELPSDGFKMLAMLEVAPL